MSCLARKAILLSASWILICFNVQAASFDCSQARSAVDRLICGDQQLSELDDQLGKVFNAAKQSADSNEAKRLTAAQIQWLRNVRNKCADTTCWVASYRNRIAELSTIKEESPAPIQKILESNAYAPSEFDSIQERDGHVIFSQYDKSGNNYDVVGLSLDDLSRKDIVLGRHGAKFIAQSEKFIIVQDEDRLTRPLVVIDQATGATLKKLKLAQNISWGRIEGNRLLVVQGGVSGYSDKAPALIFELPSLKILKQVEIFGGNDATWWNGKLLSLGRNLAAFDGNLNPLFKIELPPRRTGGQVSCAATGPLRVMGNKAVIVANCGELLIYDLASGQIERTIPAYAHFYAVAISDDGLIFTAPTSPDQTDDGRVYDLASGNELAVFPFKANKLFIKGDRVLALNYRFANTAPMTLYTFNPSALRNERCRIKAVIEKCGLAKKFVMEEGDLYRGMDTCKSSGIEGLAKSKTIPKEAIPVVQEYVRWLMQTLDRSDDAIWIIKRLLQVAPSENVSNQLAEAELKARILRGEQVNEISPDAENSAFARALINGQEITQGLTRNIRFGAFTTQFHFSGNRVYIGKYGNGNCCGGSASLGVLDRATFNEVADILIVPDDEMYQDNITSIASDAKRVYLGIEYRYEQPGRPNFAILDKSSLKVIKKAQVEGPGGLVFDNGVLLACGCSFTDSQDCKILDPETGKATDAPVKACSNSRGNDQAAVISRPRSDISSTPIVGLTEDYVITRKSWPKGAPYVVASRTDGNTVATIDVGENDWLSWPLSIDGNMMVVGRFMPGDVHIRAISLPKGKLKTMLGVSTTSARHPIPLLEKQTLYLGLGRDLLLINATDYRLRRYIKDFIVAPKKDIRPGYDDEYRIARLMIDQGRLIALTFRGKNSRIISITDLPL